MSQSSWFRPWMIPAAVPVAFMAVCSLGCLAGGPCGGLWWQYGIFQYGECPVGSVRAGADVQAYRLLRGSDDGVVLVNVQARWMARGDDHPRARTAWRGASAYLALLDDEGHPVEGFAASDETPWWGRDATRTFAVTLPADLGDGDYTLRTTVGIAGEELVVDTPVALYAPALAHVALDRPLYEPGNAVRMRSVLLRRTDQSPLPGRPGRWEIRDPQGQLVHAEKDRAAGWGVADTTFYLASDATVGAWTATWRSGDASDAVSFDVRPFSLPRFTVEAEAEKKWFHPGDPLKLSGRVTYTSGAPVADANVQVRLAVAEGRWPLPVSWEEPRTVRTDAQGRYEVEIGEIPEEELLERELSALTAMVQVTDETGETQGGRARLVISADDVRAEVLTELDGGLVGGFNNRAWIRVTTPDGVPVTDTDLMVGNPFDEGAKGHEAKTDADGVAMLQLDPGDPISVPVPAVPVRIRPRRPEPVRLNTAVVRPTNASPTLQERRVLDSLHAGIARCGDYAPGGAQVAMGGTVDRTGRVSGLGIGGRAVDRCVGDVVRGARFPADGPRALQLDWSVPDSLKPTLNSSVTGVFGTQTGAQTAISQGLVEARSCLSADRGRSGAEVFSGTWTQREGRSNLAFDLDRGGATGLAPADLACVERTLRGVVLPDEADEDALGGLSVSLYRQGESSTRKPQATFITGYPVGVVAMAGSEKKGQTLAVVGVGSVPPLRVRMTPSLPRPGETVTVDFLRGPDFYGELPRKVQLRQGSLRVAEAELPEEGKRQVTFEIPEDGRGYFHVEVNGARGIVFVQDPNPLALSLTTDKDSYAPGEQASLTVRTTEGGKPVPAAVGLSGVDETLGQLATLLGPDDMGRVTVRATADRPAFGAFDPRALALGRIRGEHAATAAVMTLTTIPMDAAGDEPVRASSQATVDDLEVLGRRFWRARAALVDKVRAWEASAPAGELLTNERLRELWNETLRDLEAAGTPAHDAFDRPLTLDNLPSTLIPRLDPREIAADATRLPEDVTSWPAWVDKEVR